MRSGLTTDPADPRLKEVRPDGQQEAYLVLSEEERAKGFVRPLRRGYVHRGVRPTHPVRDLTDDERIRLGDDYSKFEEYPGGGPLGGRYWTREQLEGGCGTVTTMGLALCETYARDPKFYGATFCVRCGEHLPVAEFRWIEADGREGPAVGS
jgi:hypothetical protein